MSWHHRHCFHYTKFDGVRIIASSHTVIHVSVCVSVCVCVYVAMSVRFRRATSEHSNPVLPSLPASIWGHIRSQTVAMTEVYIAFSTIHRALTEDRVAATMVLQVWFDPDSLLGQLAATRSVDGRRPMEDWMANEIMQQLRRRYGIEHNVIQVVSNEAGYRSITEPYVVVSSGRESGVDPNYGTAKGPVFMVNIRIADIIDLSGHEFGPATLGIPGNPQASGSLPSTSKIFSKICGHCLKDEHESILSELMTSVVVNWISGPNSVAHYEIHDWTVETLTKGSVSMQNGLMVVRSLISLTRLMVGQKSSPVGATHTSSRSPLASLTALDSRALLQQ